MALRPATTMGATAWLARNAGVRESFDPSSVIPGRQSGRLQFIAYSSATRRYSANQNTINRLMLRFFHKKENCVLHIFGFAVRSRRGYLLNIPRFAVIAKLPMKHDISPAVLNTWYQVLNTWNNACVSASFLAIRPLCTPYAVH